MNLKWNSENLSQVFWAGTRFQVSFDILLLMVMHPFTFPNIDTQKFYTAGLPELSFGLGVSMKFTVNM